MGSGGPPGVPGGPSRGLEGPPRGPGGIGRSSRRSGRAREALLEVWEAIPEVQEGSGGPPGGPEQVGRPSWRFGPPKNFGGPSGGSGVIANASQTSGKGRQALPEVWEGSGCPTKGFGGPLGGLVVVRSPSLSSNRVESLSQRSGKGSERPPVGPERGWGSLLAVQEGSEGPLGGLEDVGKPSQGPGGLFRGLGGVGNTYRRFSTSSEPLGGPQKPLGGPLKPLGGPPNLSRTSGSANRPILDLRQSLPDHQEGLPTPFGPPRGPPDPCLTYERAF